MKRAIVSLLLLYLSLTLPAQAQSLIGYVFNQKKEALPGANIYLADSNIGTISNKEGFYVLKLPAGQHMVVFSYIGYVDDTLRLTVKETETVHKTVFLKDHVLQGEEIMVFAEKYNDAQAIVRKTIENKKQYLTGIKNYEYDAYQKTIFEIHALIEQRIIGGILETKSRGYYKNPDQFQEVVLAKRQTKNFSRLTNVFTVGKIPNLLDETLIFDELTVISPLNKDALNFYQFDMIDTTYFRNRMVFNMRFAPKKSNVPLFSGKMSIIDKDFAVVSCEMQGGGQVVSNFRDSISISQKFRQYEDKYWFPTEMLMNCRINVDIPGIPFLYWQQHGLISNYRINLEDYEHSFNNTLLSYALLSEEAGDRLWDIEQVIPLSATERAAIGHIDSVVMQANVVKKAAFWSLANFDRLLITGFYDFYHFNRVQGNYFGVGFDSRRKWDNSRLRFRLGYGSADERTVYSLFFQHELIPEKLNVFVDGQNRLSFIDQFYRYNPTDITLQTTIRNNDYADYLYKKSVKIGSEYYLFQHLKVGADYEYSRQKRAPNTTANSIWGGETAYRIPFPADEGEFSLMNLSLFADNLKYFDYGWLMAPDLSQDFYDVQLSYLHSSKKNLNSDYYFERFHFYLSFYKKFPPYLHLYLRMNAGLLQGDKPLQYYFHLAGAYGSFGNPILFRTIRSDQFLGDRYAAVALENNFKNTLFSLLHLPLLKKSKIDFLVFSNMGWINNTFTGSPEFNNIRIGRRPLTEAGFSIGNLFTFFRFDFAWRLSHKTETNFSMKLTSRLFIR